METVRTSFAEMRRRGSYTKNLYNKLIASDVAAVNKSRSGCLGYWPTGW